jgi:TetR/AcrR family transcriptional regulator, mexJK operon transcriptional repressor
VPAALKRKAATGSSSKLKPKSKAAAAVARSRGGRPSLVDAAQLRKRILDVATEMFFAHGYGATSIDAIAQRAKISKRTFYHRFDDKAALFGAVLHRITEGLRPPAAMPLLAGADLQEILQRLAGIILLAALTPEALALHRLIVGESARFPKLAAAVATEGSTREAITLIAGLLAHATSEGHLGLDDPEFAAEQFLQMVLSVPQRRALGLGKPMTDVELERWRRAVVELFLNGCRTRTATKMTGRGK